VARRSRWAWSGHSTDRRWCYSGIARRLRSKSRRCSDRWIENRPFTQQRHRLSTRLEVHVLRALGDRIAGLTITGTSDHGASGSDPRYCTDLHSRRSRTR
jgi:hypothetical protein